MQPGGPLRFRLCSPRGWSRSVGIMLAGGVVAQLGGCVESFLPAALAVAEQVLLTGVLPWLPLFSW